MLQGAPAPDRQAFLPQSAGWLPSRPTTASTYAFISVVHQSDEISFFAFATMSDCHEAEKVLEASKFDEWERERSDDGMTLLRATSLWKAVQRKTSTADDVIDALSSRGELSTAA